MPRTGITFARFSRVILVMNKVTKKRSGNTNHAFKAVLLEAVYGGECSPEFGSKRQRFARTTKWDTCRHTASGALDSLEHRDAYRCMSALCRSRCVRRSSNQAVDSRQPETTTRYPQQTASSETRESRLMNIEEWGNLSTSRQASGTAGFRHIELAAQC